MIQEIKYTTLSTDASDYACNDGELSAIANLVNEDGAMQPIADFTELFTMPDGTRQVFVHESSTFDENIKRHYIFLIETEAGGEVTQTLKWCKADDVQDGEIVTLSNVVVDGSVTGRILSVGTIGNVLAVNTTNGIQYAIWQDSKYNYLGSRPADIMVRAEVTNAVRRSIYGDVPIGSNDNFDYRKYRVITDISEYMDANFFNKPLTEDDEHERLSKLEKHSELLNIILSSINTIEAKHKSNGFFCYPFLVRLAWRMFDGTSLVCHTAPILVNPCGTGRPRIYVTNADNARKLYVMIDAVELSLKINAQVGAWEELITSLDVFITPQAQGYSEDNESFVYLQKGGGEDDVRECMMSLRQSINYNGTIYSAVANRCVIIPKRADNKEAAEVIANETRFYLLKSIPLDELKSVGNDGYTTIAIKPSGYDFDNLTAKEVMTDSQGTRRRIIASDLYNYNSRLSIAANETIADAPQLVPCLNVVTGGGNVHSMKVEVENNGKREFVSCDYEDNSDLVSIDDITWLFTDNMKAKAVWVWAGTDVNGFRIPLRKHETLNGMFAFNGFSSVSREDTIGWDSADIPSEGTEIRTDMSNNILQSEVNNPFFFPSSNVVSVGVGKVMAIRAAIKAMSTSQFGEYPVYALATDGVWGIYVASDGRFSYVRLVTPDVCLNALTVAQIDSAVIFASARGLMMLSGSTATCISDSIRTSKAFNVTDLPNGDMLISAAGVSEGVVEYGSFANFIEDCRIAYDYVRQRIIVFNPTMENGERKYAYAYVYSIKGKSWGIMYTNAADVILTYGSLVFVDDSGKVVDGDIDSDFLEGINGFLMTRPIKLGLPDKLKTIRTIIQRGVFDGTHIGSVLYGSSDLLTWKLVASSRTHVISGISGSPYKYFRIGVIARLTEGESLYGCTVEYEVKHDDKVR